MPVKSERSTDTPAEQLRSFVDQLDAPLQSRFRAARAALHKRFPTANEVVYQYAHSLVVSYSPTVKGIDAILTLATRDGGLRLYFAGGPTLPDPKKLLKGSATQVRYVELPSASALTDADVEALIQAAMARAKVPMPASGKGALIIQSGGAKKAKR
jgi:hypothetical protein